MSRPDPYDTACDDQRPAGWGEDLLSEEEYLDYMHELAERKNDEPLGCGLPIDTSPATRGVAAKYTEYAARKPQPVDMESHYGDRRHQMNRR